MASRYFSLNADRTQYNGYFTNMEGLYVFSGSIANVPSNTTRIIIIPSR